MQAQKTSSPLLGIIGGVSYVSTLEYYRRINAAWAEKLADPHASLPMLIHSLDFSMVARCQQQEDWQALHEQMMQSASLLARSGCEAIVIASNTLHKVARRLEGHRRQAYCPLLHIADAVAEGSIERGVKRVALLGTRVTMQEPFYRERLKTRGAFEVLTPRLEQMQRLDHIIFEKLVCHRVLDDDRAWFLRLIEELSGQGAELVIAGCTELFLLLGEATPVIPVLDSLQMHVDQAVNFMLAKTRR